MRAVMVAALMVGVAAANPHALAGAPGGGKAGGAKPGSGVDAAYLARGGNGADWPSVGGGSDERRFSPSMRSTPAMSRSWASPGGPICPMRAARKRRR
ncbi:hypothetical protein [Sphingomonas changnyeongensis]|uniref:hypothetical protein n=1 Tax=Sphingomonas changnyeongensis TaxID=2698679 RepID=UPI001E3DCCFA|nr:hypothetical protein [Sphingomonas changnyeongensis]